MGIKMKKWFELIIIILLPIFLFTGAKNAGEFLKDFSEWIAMVDKLSDKVEALEKQLTSIQDTLESIKSDKNNIANIAARLEAIEKKREGSLGTLDTLKDGVAELRKRMEDQEVITAALEKRYLEAQRPLEPLQKAIAEQNKAISNLIARLEEEDKKINTLKENDEKNASSLEELTKKIDEKLAAFARLSEIADSLEKQVVSLEKPATKETEAVTAPRKEAEKQVESIPAGVPEKMTISDTLKAQGYQDINGGFFARDINLAAFGSSVKVSGKIMNVSESDYNVVNLNITAYNNVGSLIRSQDFSIKGIRKGDIKEFSEIISGVKMDEIGQYSLTFGKEIRPDQIVSLKAGAIAEKEGLKVEEKPVEVAEHAPPEGFTDVGNNFYVKNVDIQAFGYSCKISGILKNLSDNYFSIAPFRIRLFDKNRQLIREQDFSVKGVKEGSINRFSEVLTGVRPEDIDSYEINFKGRS